MKSTKVLIKSSLLVLSFLCTLAVQAKVTSVAPPTERKEEAKKKQTTQADPALNRSVNDSSKKATDWASIGTMAGSALGIGYMAMATTCEGTCSAAGSGCCAQVPMYIMFGTQAISAAAQFLQSKEEAKGTTERTNGNQKLTPTSSLPTSDPTFNETVFGDALKGMKVDYDKINKATAALKTKAGYHGYKYDEKTGELTGPDGKKIGGGAGGAGGGFSSADMSKAAAIAKAIKEGTEKYLADKAGLVGEESGSGGGGSKGANGSGFGGSAAMAGLAGGGKLGTEGSRSVAGMSKDYFGEPIGVANDSLFEMMKRRYQLKEKQNSFFDEYEAALQK